MYGGALCGELEAFLRASQVGRGKKQVWAVGRYLVANWKCPCST